MSEEKFAYRDVDRLMDEASPEIEWANIMAELLRVLTEMPISENQMGYRRKRNISRVRESPE